TIDITLHCFPNPISKVGLIISGGMALFSAGMGALGYFAATTDQSNFLKEAESAESESVAKIAEAEAEAAGIEATVAGRKRAGESAAMAMSLLMGLDPGVPPFTCFGNFISGSPNVL